MVNLSHQNITGRDSTIRALAFIVRPFVRAILPRMTEQRDREEITDNYAQFVTERKAAVHNSYEYLVSLARQPQDGHAKFARLSQHRTILNTAPALQPCGHCAIFSCSRTFRSILVAALQLSARLSCGSLWAFVR